MLTAEQVVRSQLEPQSESSYNWSSGSAQTSTLVFRLTHLVSSQSICVFNAFNLKEMSLSRVVIPSLDEKLAAPVEVKIHTQNVSSTFIITFSSSSGLNADNLIFNQAQVKVSISSFGVSLIANHEKKRLELAYLNLKNINIRQMTSQKSTDTLFTVEKLTLDNSSSHKPVFPKVLSTQVSGNNSRLQRFLKVFRQAGTDSPPKQNFLEVEVSKSMLKNGSLFDHIDIDLQILRLNLEEVWIDRILSFVSDLGKIQGKARRSLKQRFEDDLPKTLEETLAPFLWQYTKVQNFKHTFVKRIRVSDFKIKVNFLQNLDDAASRPLNQMKAQAMHKFGLLIPNLRGISLDFKETSERNRKHRPLDITTRKLRRNYVSQIVKIIATKLPQILVSSMIRIPKSLFNIVKNSLQNMFLKEEAARDNFLEFEGHDDE